jgi:hypothetical protein
MDSITITHPDKARRIPYAALLLFVPTLILIVSLWAMTFRFNAQLWKMTEEHNAQLWKMTEEHNAQLAALAAKFQEQK